MDPGEASENAGNHRTGSVDTLYASQSDVAEPPKKKRKTNDASPQHPNKDAIEPPKGPNVADLRMVLEQATIRNSEPLSCTNTGERVADSVRSFRCGGRRGSSEEDHQDFVEPEQRGQEAPSSEGLSPREPLPTSPGVRHLQSPY